MQASAAALGPVSWENMSQGIEKLKDRLRRAVAVLERAGVDYAVIGGNAVAAWVSRVDDSVVRNTRDVDLLVRRSDFDPIQPDFKLIDFLDLVTMKLTSYRWKDQVHLLDMIEIGQLDASWLPRVPPSLRQRLQDLLDDPDG